MAITKSRDRIASGDRARIHPANGADAYTVTLTDLGAWGLTAHVGSRLVFLPWSAVDLVERVERDGEVPGPEWCPATVNGGGAIGVERCDLTIGHDGSHVGEKSGLPFGARGIR